jgi:hypothetical protein
MLSGSLVFYQLQTLIIHQFNIFNCFEIKLDFFKTETLFELKSDNVLFSINSDINKIILKLLVFQLFIKLNSIKWII